MASSSSSLPLQPDLKEKEETDVITLIHEKMKKLDPATSNNEKTTTTTTSLNFRPFQLVGNEQVLYFIIFSSGGSMDTIDVEPGTLEEAISKLYILINNYSSRDYCDVRAVIGKKVGDTNARRHLYYYRCDGLLIKKPDIVAAMKETKKSMRKARADYFHIHISRYFSNKITEALTNKDKLFQRFLLIDRTEVEKDLNLTERTDHHSIALMLENHYKLSINYTRNLITDIGQYIITLYDEIEFQDVTMESGSGSE